MWCEKHKHQLKALVSCAGYLCDNFVCFSCLKKNLCPRQDREKLLRTLREHSDTFPVVPVYCRKCFESATNVFRSKKSDELDSEAWELVVHLCGCHKKVLCPLGTDQSSTEIQVDGVDGKMVRQWLVERGEDSEIEDENVEMGEDSESEDESVERGEDRESEDESVKRGEDLESEDENVVREEDSESEDENFLLGCEARELEEEEADSSSEPEDEPTF